ncbi:hypothetical protein HDV00_005098 [Rhizophlyctis rosea]|nr:hypothetical protein HDV00_005098 [Rhizophlyctis rosea]
MLRYLLLFLFACAAHASAVHRVRHPESTKRGIGFATATYVQVAAGFWYAVAKGSFDKWGTLIVDAVTGQKTQGQASKRNLHHSDRWSQMYTHMHGNHTAHSFFNKGLMEYSAEFHGLKSSQLIYGLHYMNVTVLDPTANLVGFIGNKTTNSNKRSHKRQGGTCYDPNLVLFSNVWEADDVTNSWPCAQDVDAGQLAQVLSDLMNGEYGATEYYHPGGVCVEGMTGGSCYGSFRLTIFDQNNICSNTDSYSCMGYQTFNNV